MSVQLNTGIHLFLQEPLLRTLLISGEVGTGKTYALLQTLHDRGRTYTTVTSHTDVSAMQEAVDIQRTLETVQIVKQAHPWDVYDLLICEGLDHFDRSMWLRILYEQSHRYEAGRPLQIIGTYTGTEGLSQWIYDMDLWIPIESPDVDTRVRVLADRDHADIYENSATRESYHGEGISVDVYGTHGEELICSKGKLMDAPGIPTVHDSIYTYISSLVEKFNISFMGMEYILLKAAIGLAREKGHQFVEPTDVESVLQWTLPQKMKKPVNPRTQQDGEAQDSSDRMPSNEARREQEERKGTSSNRGEENSSPQKAGNGQLQDGQGRVDGNHGATIGYAPNSFGQWANQPQYKDPGYDVSGKAYQYDFREDDSDYYTQPGKLFRLMTPEQQQVLFKNTANNMAGVPLFIQERHAKHCYACDPAYGEGVAKALGITVDFSTPADIG